MAKHKKQHIIPSCYLKAWCDPECPPKYAPYIWIFDKDGREGKCKSPDNIFHETDMYTIHDEVGNRDLTIEHGFSQLENIFTSIRRKKFNRHKELDHDDHFLMCMFIAVMHARTKNHLNHITNQWRRPLEMMDDLAEKMKTASIEQKKSMSSASSFSSKNDSKSLTHEQVRKIVENPVATMMLPMIQAMTPLLAKLDFAIICSNENQSFITTDTPCVWHDREAYKRSPIYRSATIGYQSTEITLPISPKQCILLNRQGLNGYYGINDEKVNEVNRLLRIYASEKYISNKNKSEDIWFEERDEPEDSWENQQKRKSHFDPE